MRVKDAVGRFGEQLAGVLPLVRRRGRLASATNWHTLEFAPIAADESVERVLVEEALRRARGRLSLDFMLERQARRASEAMTEMGYWVIVRPLELSPYVELDGSWEEFEAALPSKRRTELRRRRRRLEELGSCRFQCADGSEQLDELVAEGIEVEAAGWVGRHGTAIAVEPHAREFYEQIAEWAAEKGCLRLFFLRLDGKAIAFAFCLADAKSLYVLKIGFDPAYARYGPGHLLTQEMLAYAFGAGLRTYEFLGHLEPYKLAWTQKLRDRLRVQAFPSTPAGLASYLAWKYGRPVAKRLLRR